MNQAIKNILALWANPNSSYEEKLAVWNGAGTTDAERLATYDAAWEIASANPAMRENLLPWCVHPVGAGEVCQATFRDVPPSYAQGISDTLRAQRKAASKAAQFSFWKSVLTLFVSDSWWNSFIGTWKDDKAAKSLREANRAAIVKDAGEEKTFQQQLAALGAIPDAAVAAGRTIFAKAVFFSLLQAC